ncbi:hypothetical protein [Undibacterium sp.]|uniref:hypothetical protein n=1 Tax=Undibacterium sp. TaxID=1914977 RepID=UPI0025E16119|nr:hypothetical protein [Undibacterium sp.]
MNVKLILSGILFASVVGCASVVPTMNDIPPAIATASTPAEHQRIADFYMQKAREYDATAIQHEQTARAYLSNNKTALGAMTKHCRALRDQFSAAAKEARALAELHVQMAAGTNN